MEIVIGIIIVLLAFIAYGLYSRKKVYDHVEKLESWKIEIMNRPVTDEISQVKELNMTGQTEERFEKWRQEWDEIITVTLPNIEEQLFDAEEAADKYRFKKAKLITGAIESSLQNVEETIDRILNELEELVGSEEQNREDITEVKSTVKELRKGLLARRHTFGKAELRLEIEIDEIDEQIKAFDELTGKGDYIEAREKVLKLVERMTELKNKMEIIPTLLHDCQQELNASIDDLINGHNQMIEQGYILDKFGFIEELEEMKNKTADYLLNVEKVENITETKSSIEEMKERIDDIYEVLEKEVVAKHYIMNEGRQLRPQIDMIRKETLETKDETHFVQLSYHLEEKELAVQREIEKQVNVIANKYYEIEEKIEANATASSDIKEELESIKGQLETIQQSHVEYKEMLQTLRKDEMRAKEKLSDMKKVIVEAKRLVQKSTLPGLPKKHVDTLNEAETGIVKVAENLEEKPLNMGAINDSLSEATKNVDQLFEETKDMIEQAVLAEMVIQYGNRYRSSYEYIAAKLIEAERSFREYDYDVALEQAAAAVEEIEPGALRKLSELLDSDAVSSD